MDYTQNSSDAFRRLRRRESGQKFRTEILNFDNFKFFFGGKFLKNLMTKSLFRCFSNSYKLFNFFDVFLVTSYLVCFSFRIHAKWLNLDNRFRHIIWSESASQNNGDGNRFNYFFTHAPIMCFSGCSDLGISFLLSIEKQIISNSVVLFRQLNASLVSYWNTTHNLEVWKLLFQILHIFRRERLGGCSQVQNIRVSFTNNFNYVF